jgi:hypothetical protein
MNCGRPDKPEITRKQTIYAITAVNLIVQHTLRFEEKAKEADSPVISGRAHYGPHR